MDITQIAANTFSFVDLNSSDWMFLSLLLNSVYSCYSYSQGPGALWCDIDIVEFTYFGIPTGPPRAQTYTELVDGLRGIDPHIGAGTQVHLLANGNLLTPLWTHLLLLVCNFGCQLPHVSHIIALKMFDCNCCPKSRETARLASVIITCR